jgi:hypothetical protein
LQITGGREIIDQLFLYLASCLHAKESEHIAPIMFPPFSLSPIGFGVVEPMGIFFGLTQLFDYFTTLRLESQRNLVME